MKKFYASSPWVFWPIVIVLSGFWGSLPFAVFFVIKRRQHRRMAALALEMQTELT
jgi:hypothetical protein